MEKNIPLVLPAEGRGGGAWGPQGPLAAEPAVAIPGGLLGVPEDGSLPTQWLQCPPCPQSSREIAFPAHRPWGILGKS